MIDAFILITIIWIDSEWFLRVFIQRLVLEKKQPKTCKNYSTSTGCCPRGPDAVFRGSEVTLGQASSWM